MRFNYLLSTIAVTMLLSGCGASASMITETNNNDTASNASTAELSVEELKEFTDLFNTIEYNGFLSYDFDAPENIDWNEILKLGAQIASKDCSPEEINSYLKSTDQSDFSEYETLYAINKYDLADFIKRHTGIPHKVSGLRKNNEVHRNLVRKILCKMQAKILVKKRIYRYNLIHKKQKIGA